MTSSTSSSDPAGGRRLLRGALLALALVAGANAWVAWRLPALTPERSIGEVGVLDGRVAAFPDRAAVRLLVFGDSHAMYGLRPPALAAACGLPADGAFSLALGGASAPETVALAGRYLAAFPGARTAIVQIDEVFVGGARATAARRRFLTRFDPAERWRQAAYERGPDARIAWVAWQPFAIADFNVQLRQTMRYEPDAFWRRLAGADVPVRADHPRVLQAALPYRWGYPIGEWTPAPDYRRKWAGTRRIGPLRARTRSFLADADMLEAAFADVERLAARLEGAGLRVLLVGGTLPASTRAVLAQVAPREVARYEAALAAYLAASGRGFTPLPGLPEEAFFDADHPDETGATAIAAHLVAQRPWLRGPR